MECFWMVQLTLASEFSGLGLLVHNRSRVRVIEGDRPALLFLVCLWFGAFGGGEGERDYPDGTLEATLSFRGGVVMESAPIGTDAFNIQLRHCLPHCILHFHDLLTELSVPCIFGTDKIYLGWSWVMPGESSQ